MTESTKVVSSQEFYIRLGDTEVSLRSLSGGRVIRWTMEPFGTIEIAGESVGMPGWVADGQEVTLRQEITFTDGTKLNVTHPAFKLRLVDSGSRP